MALNENQKKRIEALWLVDDTVTSIAEKIGCSYNTAKKHVQRLNHQGINKSAISAKSEKIDKSIREQVIEIKEKQNAQLVETIINDDRMTKAADMILAILCNEDTLRGELKKAGIRNLTGLLGMITDKGLKYADLEVKRKHAKEGYNIHIDNNIGKIIDLMGEAKETSILPQNEIAEFKEEQAND